MTITVGNSADISQGHLTCYTLCGSMGFKRRKYFQCTSVLTGQYVALRKTGTDVFFTICEVEVYGPKGENTFLQYKLKRGKFLNQNNTILILDQVNSNNMLQFKMKK
jgi:hypothetical protein